MSEKFIPLSVPNLKGNELKYVTKAVETEWVSTAGVFVNEFEQSVAKYVGVDSAVACQSGTAGLHLALRVLGITEDSIVLVPTLTFIAAVNPVKYMGATPLFMDCDDSLCIDPKKLREFCENECEKQNGVLIHRSTKKRVAALVVVHVFGNMADMENILDIAEKYGLKVIEDATEALGTKYTRGKFSGCFAGTIGDIGVYSFNGNKILTTGGGGMIVSKNEDLLKKARHLSTQAKSDEQNFLHDDIGYNYRLTNLQAALGLAQMEQLEDFIKIKEQNYLHYKKEIDLIEGLELLPFREGTRSNRWFYALCCKEEYPLSSQELIEKLKKANIQSRPVWGLIHNQVPYEGSLSYKIETAEKYWKIIVNLPCSTSLTSEDVDRVIQNLR